jgi:hypothetical protein
MGFKYRLCRDASKSMRVSLRIIKVKLPYRPDNVQFFSGVNQLSSCHGSTVRTTLSEHLRLKYHRFFFS